MIRNVSEIIEVSNVYNEENVKVKIVVPLLGAPVYGTLWGLRYFNDFGCIIYSPHLC